MDLCVSSSSRRTYKCSRPECNQRLSIHFYQLADDRPTRSDSQGETRSGRASPLCTVFPASPAPQRAMLRHEALCCLFSHIYNATHFSSMISAIRVSSTIIRSVTCPQCTHASRPALFMDPLAQCMSSTLVPHDRGNDHDSTPIYAYSPLSTSTPTYACSPLSTQQHILCF